jgi:hypothetical protein
MMLANLNADAWGTIGVAALFGIVGGLLHFVATPHEPTDPATWWQSCLVGMVAAVGMLSVAVPTATVQYLSESLLAGFFGQAVVAMLQSRVTAGVERDRGARAAQVANDSIDLAERLAGTETKPAVTALRARLTEVAPRAARGQS